MSTVNSAVSDRFATITADPDRVAVSIGTPGESRRVIVSRAEFIAAIEAELGVTIVAAGGSLDTEAAR